MLGAQRYIYLLERCLIGALACLPMANCLGGIRSCRGVRSRPLLCWRSSCTAWLVCHLKNTSNILLRLGDFSYLLATKTYKLLQKVSSAKFFKIYYPREKGLQVHLVQIPMDVNARDTKPKCSVY